MTNYSRVVAKVNRKQNNSNLEILIPNISKTADNKNEKNLIEIDGCNTVLEPEKLDDFIKEENIVNTSMVSYPKMDSSTNSLCPVNALRSIVSKDDLNLENLLRKKDRYNSIRKWNWILNIEKFIRNDIDFLDIIPDFDSDSLIVKDQVQSLDDNHIWYDLFYNKTNDNISFTTGWTQKK